jgi:hypothetical protein
MTTNEIKQQHQKMVSEINSETEYDKKSIQPLTFQTEDNTETQSYATANSQDPTHKNHKQDLRATSQPRPSQNRYPFSRPAPDFPDKLKNDSSINPAPNEEKSDNDILLTEHTLTSCNDPVTTSPWPGVSPSKQKAKSSPEWAPNTSAIHKVTNSSLIHNYLLEARDSATGRAGPKK